ncbi:hypothetical protein ZEAMMB73_Zm00001d006589 [Zea mays]|uniref:Uncharacterized protein n=1 Tax=Zea mays TaxID=4577 RepID=A0A1D6EY37_MAIZE|nr:hypothetical protein ZEAMMB73_Zm00001d006589 [Zea mays]
MRCGGRRRRGRGTVAVRSGELALGDPVTPPLFDIGTPFPRPLSDSIVGAPRSCPLLHRRFREAMPPSSCPAFWPPSHPLVASSTRSRLASADGWVGRRGHGVRSPRARAGAAISSLTVPPTPACAPPRRILPLYTDIDTNKACGLGLGDRIGSVPRHLPLVSRWRE